MLVRSNEFLIPSFYALSRHRLYGYRFASHRLSWIIVRARTSPGSFNFFPQGVEARRVLATDLVRRRLNENIVKFWLSW